MIFDGQDLKGSLILVDVFLVNVEWNTTPDSNKKNDQASICVWGGGEEKVMLRMQPKSRDVSAPCTQPCGIRTQRLILNINFKTCSHEL